MESFGELLRGYRERERWSQNALAHEVGCDPSYVHRFEQGDRAPPRGHIVEALARTLALSAPERNRLMLAGGWAPPSLVQIGAWPAVVQAVCDVLNCPDLTAAEQDAFCDVVRTMARQWIHGAKVPAPWYGTQAVYRNGAADQVLAGRKL